MRRIYAAMMLSPVLGAANQQRHPVSTERLGESPGCLFVYVNQSADPQMRSNGCAS